MLAPLAQYRKRHSRHSLTQPCSCKPCLACYRHRNRVQRMSSFYFDTQKVAEAGVEPKQSGYPTDSFCASLTAKLALVAGDLVPRKQLRRHAEVSHVHHKGGTCKLRSRTQ